MLKHQFMADFRQTAQWEIQKLKKRATFKWIMKEAVKIMPLSLLWVFKYKYNTDGYLTKLKVYLCIRDNL